MMSIMAHGRWYTMPFTKSYSQNLEFDVLRALGDPHGDGVDTSTGRFKCAIPRVHAHPSRELRELVLGVDHPILKAAKAYRKGTWTPRTASRTNTFMQRLLQPFGVLDMAL
jgi:hypothetical protein